MTGETLDDLDSHSLHGRAEVLRVSRAIKEENRGRGTSLLMSTFNKFKHKKLPRLIIYEAVIVIITV